MVVDEDLYYPKVELKPRVPDLPWIKPKALKKRPKWTIPKSLFKGYKYDNAYLYKKCFEFDWNLSRI